MRRIWTLAALALLAVSPSCDTTQPAAVGSQTLSIDFFTANAVVPLWNLWDLFQDDGTGQPRDTNGDGQPDVVAILCEEDADPQGNPRSRNAQTIPWYFALEIELFRAGATGAEPLSTSVSATVPSSNMTPYDDQQELGPACPTSQPCQGNGQGDGILYRNPRRISSAHRFFFDTPPAGSPPRFGCPDHQPLGEPGLHSPTGAGDPPRTGWPLIIELAKGDTVVVRARKGPRPAGIDSLSEPSVASRAMLSGQQVALEGTGPVVGGDLSYVVTVR